MTRITVSRSLRLLMLLFVLGAFTACSTDDNQPPFGPDAMDKKSNSEKQSDQNNSTAARPSSDASGDGPARNTRFPEFPAAFFRSII